MQYSIGQFSTMMDIGKKTLRYYDEISLFKPEYVNETNQYRFYSEAQIPELEKILELREIGIPLEEIRKINCKTNNIEIVDLLLNRLDDIEGAIIKLQHQKKLINNHINGVQLKQDTSTDFKITEGDFITEGYVYYYKKDIRIEEIHQAINDFYHNLNGLRLISGHIFKRNLLDDKQEISEIFAYVDIKEEGPIVRVQEKLKTIKLRCESIAMKTNAYKRLFNYSAEKSYHLGDIFERYSIGDTGMQIDIIASIE